MSIDPRFLDELRNRLTLSEIIGRRIKVTRAGHESKACCPFHHEKTPSFTISDEKQFYHCFGCGAHGDVIGFVMKHDNLSFMDALEMLAAEAGMQVPKQTPQAAEKSRKEKDLYALLEDATAYFEKNLHEPQNRDALDYLLERGISKETITTFRLGFAPDDGQALRKFLRSKGYTDKNMLDAGILKPSTRGGEPYAFFRDRVMFPVSDRRGRVVAFGGRVLPSHLRPPQRQDFTPPKYINSSETLLFHKGKMLYGEQIARRAAANGEPIILVEGYLDVIACVQSGIKGALAPMGTAVTEEQIIALWHMIPDFTKVPILCFDGDNAGRKAARRVSERILPLLEPGKSVSFAFMPDGEDPDSLLRSSGAKAFQKILDRSLSLFDFIWDFYTAERNFKTPEMRAGVIKQLENEVSHINRQEVQVHYKSLLRQKVSDTFFPRKEYGSRKNPQQNWQKGNILARPRSSLSRSVYLFPRVLLACLINHPHIFDGVEEILSSLVLKDVSLERLRQNIINILSDNPTITRDEFIEQLKNIGFKQEIDDICNESVYVHASFCSPFTKQENVQSKWLEYWGDINASTLEKEIQSGWKRAYLDSSEKEEEKLRNLLLTKTSGDLH